MDPSTELGLEILALFVIGVVIVLLYLHSSASRQRDMIANALDSLDDD